jgi:hypothetical protein
MIIPITIHPATSYTAPLPSSLAQISHGEYVLLEIQGALHVECTEPHARDGQLVGRLRVGGGGEGGKGDPVGGFCVLVSG